MTTSGNYVLRVTDAFAGPLFEPLTFKVSESEIVGIVGVSGSGKTTLLEHIARAAHEGAAGVAFAAGNGATISYLPQNPRHLFAGQLTARVVARLIGAGAVDYEESFSRLLAALSIDAAEARRRPIDAFSGGQTQRIAIAATLGRGARLWLADEPTASLDPTNRVRLAGVVRDERERSGLTAIIASHDARFLESVCDRVLQIEERALKPAPAPKRQVEHRPRIAPSNFPPIARLDRVSLFYRGADGKRIDVIRDYEGAFEVGRVSGIAGRSGGGKSTLLRLLAGHAAPTSGRVRRYGVRRALMVPQDARFFFDPRMDMSTYARLMAEGCAPQPALEALVAMAGQIEISNPETVFSRTASLVSGGEAQRLAVATALWLAPGMICLDEVDSGISTSQKALLSAMLRAWVSEAPGERGIVIASHDLSFLMETCDRVVDLDGDASFRGHGQRNLA